MLANQLSRQRVCSYEQQQKKGRESKWTNSSGVKIYLQMCI